MMAMGLWSRCERRLVRVVSFAEAANAADARHALFIAREAAACVAIGRAVAGAPGIVLRMGSWRKRDRCEKEAEHGKRDLHGFLLFLTCCRDSSAITNSCRGACGPGAAPAPRRSIERPSGPHTCRSRCKSRPNHEPSPCTVRNWKSRN